MNIHRLTKNKIELCELVIKNARFNADYLLLGSEPSSFNLL